jgi:hypothetical protein
MINMHLLTRVGFGLLEYVPNTLHKSFFCYTYYFELCHFKIKSAKWFSTALSHNTIDAAAPASQ